jgi:hypothetical protein
MHVREKNVAKSMYGGVGGGLHEAEYRDVDKAEMQSKQGWASLLSQSSLSLCTFSCPVLPCSALRPSPLFVLVGSLSYLCAAACGVLR